MNFFNTLNCKAEIKDIDTSKRTVSGYFSKFGNQDSDNDIMVKGAFARTIKENGVHGTDRIKHLKNHDPNKLIGKLVELKEDDNGLFFTSILSQNTHGKDALIEYQEGILTEHSIGFVILQSDRQDDGVQLIKEVKLFEGSAVTWGANADTPVTEIKSMSNEQLAKELDNVVKYCKVGSLSDDLLSSVEIKIKQIQQEIAERAGFTASKIEAPASTPEKELDVLNIFWKGFNNQKH